MSEHGWTRHGHRCCDQATGTRPARVARCGGPAICRECATDAAIRHSPGSGTFAAPTSPSEPVPSTPRVWAMPELPADVSAVRDCFGNEWARGGQYGPGELWHCRTDKGEYYRPLTSFELLRGRGPLTEVEETNDAD